MNSINKSSISFTNPIIEKWIFEKHNDYIQGTSTKISAAIETIISEKNNNNAKLMLRFKVGEGNDTTPFYIEGNISSYFHWEDDMKNVDEFLDANCSSILISYLRPIIAQFTSFAGFTPLFIPFIDVNSLNKNDEDELNET